MEATQRTRLATEFRGLLAAVCRKLLESVGGLGVWAYGCTNSCAPRPHAITPTRPYAKRCPKTAGCAKQVRSGRTPLQVGFALSIQYLLTHETIPHLRRPVSLRRSLLVPVCRTARRGPGGGGPGERSSDRSGGCTRDVLCHVGKARSNLSGTHTVHMCPVSVTLFCSCHADPGRKG